MLSTSAKWIIADESVVTEFPPNVRVVKTVISPDLRNVAYVADLGDSQRVVVDQRVDLPCLSVSSLSFNAGHLSYNAELPEDRWCVVVDGKMGQHYDVACAPIFSPDGAHFVYEASRDGNTYLVLDNEEIGPFNFIPWDPVWSADSQHFAYSVEDEKGMHIVLDGQPGPSWTILSEIQFHPVTNELAYLAESQDKRCVIIGKDAFEIAGDSLSDLVCNPATRQFAVQVYVDGGARLHTQQTTSAPLCSFITTLIYSQDGNHFAYAAEIDDRQYVLLDHEPGMAFDTIRQRSLTFSPDGSRLVYVAESEDQRLLVEHLSVQWAPYEDISWNSLRFSSNGAHFAYTACIDHRWHLIIDGTPSAPHDDVGIPVFSPDSEHLAYRVRDGEEWRVIIDERPASRALTVVSDPQFTTGNEDVVYLAGEGNQFRFVEVVRYQ